MITLQTGAESGCHHPHRFNQATTRFQGWIFSFLFFFEDKELCCRCHGEGSSAGFFALVASFRYALWLLPDKEGENGMRIMKRYVLSSAMTLTLLAMPAADAEEWLYTVRPGDNLWNVSAEYLTKMDYWPQLQTLNQIANPQQLPPGMKLRIPIAWLKRLPATAQVLSTRGDARVMIAATNQATTLNPGQFLKSGDTVLTGGDGNATLEFGDGSRLLVQANSELRLKTLNSYGGTNVTDTLLQLLRGRVENQVVPQSRAGSRYEISTPVATSAVRGTRYRLGMETGTAIARTEVLEGGVRFQSGRSAQAVAKGFGSLAEANKPLKPPVSLLAPPAVAELPPVVTRVPIQIGFSAVKGATMYRVQIAPDDRFETLLFDAVSASPAVRGPDLPDGEYVLRLRGIDAKGLEGRDAYHRFRLHARPEPPFLIEPPHQGVVLEKALSFKWSEPDKAKNYHFQIARDEHFTTPLLDKTDYDRVTLTPEQTLEPGNYYWRVALRDSSDRVGPFSDPQSFRVQATPEMQPPEVAAETMTFRWSAGLPDQRYHFQLARDVDFADIVVSKEVPESQLRIARPASGFYYLRIRSIEPDGSAGPYGPAQRIEVPPASYWPLGLVVLLTLVLAL